MENSKIKFIFQILSKPNFNMENLIQTTHFSNIFHVHLCFCLHQSKMAYKISQKIFSQTFTKISIYCIFLNKRSGRLFKSLTFQEVFIQEGHLIVRVVYLEIRSIVDTAFFFDTRQAIDKTSNLHYNLFTCFILDHIHFFIGILFVRGRNEWIYGITFVN